MTLCISSACVRACGMHVNAGGGCSSGAVHLCSDKVSLLTCLERTTLLRLAGHQAPGSCLPSTGNYKLFNTGSGDQTLTPEHL